MAGGSPKGLDLPDTAYGVLGLLTFGEMSGYDLMKLVHRSIGFFWSPAKSQIYSELRRLVSVGYATERRVRQEDRPDKRLFLITPMGERALRDWLEGSEVAPDTVKSPLLLKLFFAHLMDGEVLMTQLKAVRQEYQERLAEFRRIEGEIAGREEAFFPYLTLKAGLAYAQAGTRWLDEVMRELEQRERKGGKQ